MPCYEAADTLDQAVSSLLEQTFPDFEIIAVDDGSRDATLQQLKAWARKDRRIRVLAIPHGGIVAALNAGVRLCEAPLIARMDADDRSHPERLAAQVAYLSEHPALAAVGCWVEGFPQATLRAGFQIYIEWLNSLVAPEEIARQIYIESPLAHPSVVIRRDWLDRVGGYQDRGWPEDYDLWLRMHLAGARFGKIPRVLLAWREHPRRLTRTDSRYSVENFLRAKAHYLCQGPLQDRDGVILWGAGQMGRRISKHLLRAGVGLEAFLEIDPKKIGRAMRGIPVVPVEQLMQRWARCRRPALLAAVGSRGARDQIRAHLRSLKLVEGEDWWAVA